MKGMIPVMFRFFHSFRVEDKLMYDPVERIIYPRYENIKLLWIFFFSHTNYLSSMNM